MSRSPRHRVRGARDSPLSDHDDGGPHMSPAADPPRVWDPNDPYPPPKRSPVTHSAPRHAQKPGPDDPIKTHSKSRRKDWDSQCTWVRWSLDPDLSDLAPLRARSPPSKAVVAKRRVRRKRKKKTKGSKKSNSNNPNGDIYNDNNNSGGNINDGNHDGIINNNNNSNINSNSNSNNNDPYPPKRTAVSQTATQTPRDASAQTTLSGSSDEEDDRSDLYYSSDEESPVNKFDREKGITADAITRGSGATRVDREYGDGPPGAPGDPAFVEGLLRYEKQSVEDNSSNNNNNANNANKNRNDDDGANNSNEGEIVGRSARPKLSDAELLSRTVALQEASRACDSAISSSSGKRKVVVFFTCSPDTSDVIEKVKRNVYPEIARYCRQRGDLEFCEEVPPIEIPDEMASQPGTQALRLQMLSKCLPLFVAVLGEDYGDAAQLADVDKGILASHPQIGKSYDHNHNHSYGGNNGSNNGNNGYGHSLLSMEMDVAMAHAERSPSAGTIAYLIKTPTRGINEPRVRNARAMEVLRDRVVNSRMVVLQASSRQAAAQQMAQEMISAIQAEYPRLEDLRRIMPIAIVRESHESFVAASGSEQLAVPHSALIAKISDYVNDSPSSPVDRGCPLVISSEYSSAGTTSAITTWMSTSRHFTRPDDMVFRFSHFCGISGAQGSPNSLVFRLTRELRGFLNEEMVLGSMDPAEFGRELPALFQTLSKAGMSAIIVVDGLGSLSGPSSSSSNLASSGGLMASHGTPLEWLPTQFPDSVKVVLGIGCDASLQFEAKRRHWDAINLSPFSGPECEAVLVAEQATAHGAEYLDGEDVKLLAFAAEARPGARANPLFLKLAASLLCDPKRTLPTEDIVQCEDQGALYTLVLDTLEERAPAGFPRITSDVLSALQLSVHGMSKAELLHVLGIPSSLFDAHFGPFAHMLFLQLSRDTLPEQQAQQLQQMRDGGVGTVDTALSQAIYTSQGRRVTLFCDALREVVTSRYLATQELTRHARLLLIEHFEGFIGPGTLERLPTLDEIITCGRDGDFARSAHELAWALIREEAWQYVGQLIGNLAVFRTLWSSDVRRDVYLMWLTLQQHVDPVDVYWDPIIDLYWTTTDDTGKQDLPRTLPLARLAADVGELFLLLGNPAAAKLISLAIELYKKLHGSDQHPDVARCHYMLGHLYRGNPGSIIQAISAFESSYNIYARTIGNHIGAVDALVSLGEVLIMQGALNEALEALRLAKKMLEDMGVSDFHPQSARCFNNMGLIAKKTGQLSASEAYYKKALSIRVEAYGEDHPHTAVTLRNLGSLAFSMNRRDAAVGHFTRALKISKNVHGPMHANTAATHEWLGGILQEMGNETEGKVHAATAAFIREKVRKMAEEARTKARRSDRYGTSQELDPKVVALPRPGRDADDGHSHHQHQQQQQQQQQQQLPPDDRTVDV